MKCFYHNSVDAVAICKNCNKGVCPQCAAEVGNGIACKSKCEAEVAAINEIINRSKTAHQRSASAFSRNAIIYLMIGVLFVGWGGWDVQTRPALGLFLLLAGAVFLAGALMSYSTSKKYARSEPEKGDT